MLKNSKSLGAVVATSILLVVVVIATVTFQNWFTSFEANVLAEVESDDKGGVSSTGIQDIFLTKLYFRNDLTKNLTITKVTANGVDCEIGATRVNPDELESIDISNCLLNTSDEVKDFAIITDKGTFTKDDFIENIDVLTNARTFSGNANLDVWFFSPGSELANGATIDNEGNIIIVGNKVADFSGSINDYVTYKYDKFGNHLWNVTHNYTINDQNYYVDTDENNNIFSAGTTYLSGDNNVSIFSYTPGGVQRWNTTVEYGSSSAALLSDMKVDNEGNVVYVGRTNENAGTYNILAKKFSNIDGSELWNYSHINNVGTDSVGGLAIDGLNNIYLSGSFYNSSLGFRELAILKLSSEGKHIWNITTSIHPGANEGFSEGEITSNNDLVVLRTKYIDPNYVVTLRKYDSDGTLLWHENKSYTGFQTFQVYNMEIDNQNNIFLVGYYNVSSVYEGMVLKYDPNGIYITNATFSEAPNSTQWRSFAIGDEDEIVVAGSKYAPTDNHDIFITRYS